MSSRTDDGGAAERDLLAAIGLALLALREVLQGSGDARLAWSYLFFHLDVNDPQVTPLLEQHGVDPGAGPALEEYVCRVLRPLMRQIDAGEAHATGWAEAARAQIAELVRRRSGSRERAREMLREELASADTQVRESWRAALSEHAWPGAGAGRLLGAIGILQEVFGARVSVAASDPWRVEEGGIE